MSTTTPEDLLRHAGHDMVIVGRGGGENLAAECITCDVVLAHAYRPGMNGPDGAADDRLYEACRPHLGHTLAVSGGGGRAELRCARCDVALPHTFRPAPAPVLTLDSSGVTTEAFNFPEGTFADLSAERGNFYVLLMEDGDTAEDAWALAGPLDTRDEASDLVERAVDLAYNLIDKNLNCYHAFVGRIEHMPQLVGEFNEQLGVADTEIPF